MLDSDELLNILCQLKSSQKSEIQPKMEIFGNYWPSVTGIMFKKRKNKAVLST